MALDPQSVEMADIRGLDIDKLAKGFAEEQYVLKALCQVSSMTGDSIRWYQKTAGTLTATAPSKLTSSRLANPTNIEVTWERNTSYPVPYKVEGFISMEEIKSADLDVLATTIRDLTLAITKAVDTDIWEIMSEGQAPSADYPIQSFATTAVGGDQWDADNYAADIIKDLMHAKKLIWDYNYNPEGATLLVNPHDYESIVTWIISGKGSSIPGFSSEKVKSGVVMSLLGLNVRVSSVVTTDYALVIIPSRATTYKEQFPLTARTIEEVGMGTKIRIWTHGIAYNTDPKAIVLITDTKTA
ncbi:MAG: hypothetical protein KAJ19_26010 [Gammaproteobacteria bacterium]|nr:hypothetical protein [Gammaproteobacteria bacterium]